eukprot:CAMPEP_0206172798 /NCGR_PEP_ID=MMETSP1474-20131121/46741_1 /ASSEMBLY_ACC=CAM_ASM_001110 /TAXON_ID=97495 /ORGANISM="Imantonia sp., Strain RCC918" /LENGTH=46 /DNA_ID= /DNA_START= /DNA_END= /DNA_ORIENTATION=
MPAVAAYASSVPLPGKPILCARLPRPVGVAVLRVARSYRPIGEGER